MVEAENIIELEYVTTYDTNSLNTMRVEEEMSTTSQGEVGKSSRT
jgi:hypothetical protein